LEVVINDKKVLEQAHIGVDFQMSELIEKLPKEDARLAMKKERQEKWHQMVTYGLDADLEPLVIKSTSSGN
jgi:hypothetical protein